MFIGSTPAMPASRRASIGSFPAELPQAIYNFPRRGACRLGP